MKRRIHLSGGLKTDWRLVCVLGCAGLAACGGGGTVETSVRLPAAERPDVVPTATSEAIRVPADVAFNYPRFSSGQEGPDARGSASAAGVDGAICFAEAKGQGKAWGSFQLGYAFDHQSKSASHCVVRIRLTAAESGAASKNDGVTDGQSADGSVALVFFMKDSMGLTVKEESLAASTLNRGPREATTQHDFVFDAELQPERGYYVIVSGRVDTSSVEGTASRVELKVSDVAMDIRWDGDLTGGARAAAQGS
ncbi:MAG: hypothetical protein H6819_11135 [Phycisphaerales bacterium]|nr:hypothetical protein [Phycisphaerales bacterium]MCB9855887.1 hypothetical protein [Phycisphaerales bacterium]